MNKDSTADTEIQPAGLAAKAYEELGWKLVHFDWQTKSPKRKGWQLERNAQPVPETWMGNVGLLHAYSGTCCVDVDDLRRATRWLFIDHGVDLNALLNAPDAVQIISGSDNRAKLVYRLPEPYQKVFVKEDGHQIIDFRCATRKGTTCQDVLPPSMHPDGHHYEWGGAGHWSNLPEIPDELKAVWEHLIDSREGHFDDDEDHASNGNAALDEDPVTLLGFVDPDLDREAWVEVGMAFHAAGGDYGAWDEWSSRGTKYNGPEDTRSVWDSFDRVDGGVGVGTLFHHAIEGGWVRPGPTPEEMFGSLDVQEVVEAPTLSLESIKAEIAALTVHDSTPVPNLLKRMALVEEIRTLDTVARPLCDDIAGRTNLLKSSVWDDFKKSRKLYKQTARKNRLAPAAAPENKVGEYLRMLAHPLIHNPWTIKQVCARYVYLESGPFHGKFFDRKVGCAVSKATFDLSLASATAALLGDESMMPPSIFFLSVGMARLDGIDFAPGEDLVFLDRGDEGNEALLLNSWTKGGLAPVEGDVSPWLDHLAWLVQDGPTRDHLLQWFAFTLRHPGIKINHQVILGGVPRIGKDTLLVPLLDGLGSQNHTAVAPSQLAEPFQDWAYCHKLAVFNELHGAGIGHSKLENLLKPFAAAPPGHLSLRLFGASAGVRQRNVIHIVATTNFYDAMQFEHSPERWLSVWCDPSEKQSQGYYKALWDWLQYEDGSAKVIHHLLNEVDLRGFEPAAPAPETLWQTNLVEQSQSDDVVGEWMAELYAQRLSPFDKGLFRAREVVEAIHTRLPTGDRRARGQVNTKTVTCWLQQNDFLSSGRKVARIGGKNPTTLGLWCIPEIADKMKSATGTDWLKKYKDQQDDAFKILFE